MSLPAIQTTNPNDEKEQEFVINNHTANFQSVDREDFFDREFQSTSKKRSEATGTITTNKTESVIVTQGSVDRDD